MTFFALFRCKALVRASDTDTYHQPSQSRPQLHPPSPALPTVKGTAGIFTECRLNHGSTTRPPTAPSHWPVRSMRSRSSGLTGTTQTLQSPSGQDTGPAPSSLCPTLDQSAPTPPAPLQYLVPAPTTTGGAPIIEAPPSCRSSG